MKYFFLACCVLTSLTILAQPTPVQVKKYKIMKAVERRIGDADTLTQFWYFDRKGYDSIQSMFNNPVAYRYSFKNGRVDTKTVLRAGVNEASKDDVYQYEYKPDGSYKETFTDGSFGMKSYQWFDKKGNVLKSQSPDGNTTTYKYDTKGNISQVVSDGHNSGVKLNHKYTYNAKGQMTKEDRSTDGNTALTIYQYNAKGQAIATTTSMKWEGEISESKGTNEYNSKGLLAKRTLKITAADGAESIVVYEYEYEYHP